jgi:hypothetical protein
MSPPDRETAQAREVTYKTEKDNSESWASVRMTEELFNIASSRAPNTEFVINNWLKPVA